MAKTLRFTLLAALLSIVASACAGVINAPLRPIQTNAALPTSTPSISLIQDSPTAGQTTPEAVIGSPVPGLLPHSLYFLNDMGSGNSQVWELSPDGASLTQITFENYPVSDFAVSSLDGSIVFISQNRLYYARAANRNRALLLNGAQEESAVNVASQYITSPRWSPDGKSLAFGYGGINIFMPGNGKITRLIENGLLETSPGSGVFVQAEYAPYAWSLDNQRLMIAITLKGTGSTLAVFSPANGSMIRLHMVSASSSPDLVCCQASWSNDNKSLFVANYYVNLDQSSGLWRYDPATGAGVALIPTTEKDGTYNYAGWPIQLNNGRLLYWFANSPERVDREMPMKLVSSAADELFNREVVRTDAILPDEVLWSEPARLALIVQSAPGSAARKTGGPVILVPWSGDPAQPLLADAYRLQWGP